MCVTLENVNRRHSDPEVEQIEDDQRAFKEMGIHNKLIARERIAEYRAKQILETLETEVVH